jgi:tetratricopeptide (TPR) repeat protein
VKILDLAIVRLFRTSFLFRLTFYGLVLFLLGIGIFATWLWKSSIRDSLRPDIKVSRLHAIQSWALKRSAQKAVAEGRWDEAISAWSAAVGANPNNPELMRGLLRTILKVPDPRPLAQLAEDHSGWLLRLAGYQEADLELSAEVYEKYRFYDSMVNLLKPMEGRLSPTLERFYLKALLHTDHAEAFGRRWERVGKLFESDPEMQLYHTAYLAGWGSPGTVGQARQQLADAREDKVRRLVALRLQLTVSQHLSDGGAYAEGLQRLTEWQANGVADEVGYWRLLALTGQKTAGIRRAEHYPYPPLNGKETDWLALGYAQLGMRDAAKQLLQRYVPQFGSTPALWLRYANLLVEDREWDALWTLALQMRQQVAARGRLEGFSYYLEGRAELGRQRSLEAAAAFEKAPQFRFDDPGLAMTMAESLLEVGFAKPAGEVLDRLAKGVINNPAYWQLRFSVACALKKADDALGAATTLHKLWPEDLVTMNNYAGVLLTLRQRPDEAIKITMMLAAKLPRSIEVRINHSLALLLNERTPEARDMLQSIDPSQLPAKYVTAFYQAWLEVYLKERDFVQASKAIEKIDANQLFPCEVQWLKEARLQIAAGTVPAAKQ